MRYKTNRGFTIVELLIVIVVIAIVAAVVIVAYNGIQARASDTTRESNVRSIAKKLEVFYVENGFYPPFSQPGDIGLNVASWRQANLPSLSSSVLTPPGASSVSLVNSDTPTVSQYGYRNGGGCLQCPRFFLYWRSGVDGTVKTLLSLNGH